MQNIISPVSVALEQLICSAKTAAGEGIIRLSHEGDTN